MQLVNLAGYVNIKNIMVHVPQSSTLLELIFKTSLTSAFQKLEFSLNEFHHPLFRSSEVLGSYHRYR